MMKLAAVSITGYLPEGFCETDDGNYCPRFDARTLRCCVTGERLLMSRSCARRSPNCPMPMVGLLFDAVPVARNASEVGV